MSITRRHKLISVFSYLLAFLDVTFSSQVPLEHSESLVNVVLVRCMRGTGMVLMWYWYDADATGTSAGVVLVWYGCCTCMMQVLYWYGAGAILVRCGCGTGMVRV